jgi:hypothetical protein
MSHAKQLHHRHYFEDSLASSERTGLPGNVNNAVYQYRCCTTDVA